jgi:peptide/nickel transport system substrate-binding protein
MSMKGFALSLFLLAGLSAPLAAQTKDSVTIAVPTDVQSWDAQVTNATAQTLILRQVFDPPLVQNEKLELVPHVIDQWTWSEDGKALRIRLRDDVYFHNGDKLTTEDFKFSYFTRMHDDAKRLQFSTVFKPITDIEIVSPTEAVIHLDRTFPALPNWLGFLGQFITPKKYFEEVGAEEFARRPVGSGPYKLAEYTPGSRIVLEANDKYWGGAPKIKRVVFEIIKDPTARVAAIQSGTVDLVTGVPIREAQRLDKQEGLVGQIEPTTEIYDVGLRNFPGLQDRNVRLAAFHAIDRKALSDAFFGGKANVVNAFGIPGMPSYPEDLEMGYDPELAAKYLADSGYGPNNPAKFDFVATNGAFPNDYDVARAIVAMWQKVGIQPNFEVVDLNKYYELSRSGNLKGASLAVWANATNDPELYIGSALDPKSRFVMWKDEALSAKIDPLLGEKDQAARMKGYEELNRYASEEALVIPLLQAVQTVVRKEKLNFTWIPNSWYEPAKMSWSE